VLQRTGNTLAHVVLVFLNIAQHIIVFCGDTQNKGILLHDIEKRWKTEENPLFFLSFLLHPTYRRCAQTILSKATEKKGSWVTDRNVLSEGRMRQAVVFYYRKFRLYQSENEDAEQQHLVKQFSIWMSGAIKLDDVTFMSYQGEYPAEWWLYHKSELPQLSRFAVFLLSAPVQGADCGRLFKDLAAFHTKSRPRMHSTTIFGSAAIAHSLRRKYSQDYEKNSGSKTRNRFISPEEYDKVDALSSPTRININDEDVRSYPLRQPSQPSQVQYQSQRNPNSATRSTDEQGDVESVSSGSNSGNDLEEEDDMELDLSNSTHMQKQLELLEEAVESD
jgi:hypothetical protein